MADPAVRLTSDRSPISLIFHGDNPTRIWGMDNAERFRRIAAKTKGTGRIWTNLAYAVDPAWFRHIVKHPGMMVTLGNEPVLAHLRDGDTAPGAGYEILHYASNPSLYNDELRKRETPFIERLTPENIRLIERKSYFGAYKGVTDLLTKYLWPELALILTRWAARIGMTPNMITGIGIALCVLATFLFAEGHYWEGVAAGFVFMVLDTVDGKLARCTITSSKIGNILDHGVDLVHPPFWYWAWGLGLAYTGLRLDGHIFGAIMLTIVAGYILQRLIEGAFIRKFGIHIHVWRKFDSDFRLITARRNPNMILLVGSLLFGRPDLGLIAVAIWTLLSLVVHALQLAQALAEAARGGRLRSWLTDGE